MIFEYTPELLNYMKRKNHKNIIVEVAQSDGDFEITELHPHFVSDKQADLFIKRKGFHKYDTEIGVVLLPNYRLTYSPTVTFGIKKVLFLNLVSVDGISL